MIAARIIFYKMKADSSMNRGLINTELAIFFLLMTPKKSLQILRMEVGDATCQKFLNFKKKQYNHLNSYIPDNRLHWRVQR